MAAPSTVDEFLDLVRKSGVADEKRLEACLLKMRERPLAQPSQTAAALIHDGVITHFQAEHLLAGKWRRFSIGKYKILERLGSGGMGQVFLCEHKLMRRRVAVKVLPTARAKDSSALERFYREARAVAALTHPNIVHAYDIDQDDDLHFLVMEYVDGANLQELVKKAGPLEVSRACYYIRQSALALQHAHEAGLVHRDVKPGNILVDRSGVVKILDLGLARFFHDEDDILTKKYDESVLGTADYLSPEQALDSHAADIRADIYSLGATFYFLLTGRPPFESTNVAQKLMMHQLREPKPVAEYRNDVPAGVVAILKKMLAKQVEQRYSVPADVADALRPFTSDAIPPPADAEMPHLSPAATGQFLVPEGGETTVNKHDTPILPKRTIPDSSPGKIRLAEVIAPPMAQPVAKAALAEAPPWEDLKSDTEDPSARADTQPHSAPSSSKSAKTLKSHKTHSVFVTVLVSVVLLISLFLTGTIGLLIWYFSPAPVAPTPLGPSKLEVGKNRPKGYPSIQAALRDAHMGSIIELWDEIHEENVVIDPARGPTKITLQAALGKEVRWRSKSADPITPLVRLNKASDFTFNGREIVLDGALSGGRQLDHLIAITSDCSGLTIEDLQLKSFARYAILVMNATGSEDRPIKLAHLTTITEKTEKPLAAIYFNAIPKMIPSKNDFITIEACEFRGLDPQKAIQFKDANVLEKNVHWPGR